MAKLCLECGKPLPPFIGKGRDNQLYHKEPCSRIVRNRRRAESYKIERVRDQRRNKWPIPPKPYVRVIYPDVDLPDYWSRKDYDMYKHELPAGATVHYD
jgi:hypothetical protein